MNLKHNILIIFFLSLSTISQAQNSAPVVSNVAHSYNSETSVITITYNVTDSQENIVSILMEVSDDGGETYNYACTQVSGDIGENVNTGSGKTITWVHDAEHGSPPSGNNFIVKIVADDLVGDQIYYAGQIYNTVTIGTQTWLKENLNVGTMINSTTTGFQQTDNGIIEKYCYNNASHCENYGGLYEWTEAMQYITTPGTRGICPEGWHIPTLAEFNTLSNFVEGNGNALKEVGQGEGSGVGTNTSGFSALLAGYRASNITSFQYLNDFTFFWSSTQYNDTFAYLIYLDDGSSDVAIEDYYKDYGLSVRCIQD